ncbi:MAG TPA: hypothetical protein DCQ97_02440 [Chitinophagaceae bacterium]|nr:hypothetical protein [Chitinophagaceae bacterium]
MKWLFTSLLVTVSLCSSAQDKLAPAKNVVDKKWLTSQQFQMIWYFLKDTARIEAGRFSTEISTVSGKLTLITRVTMKRSNAPWIDSSIALLKNLQPVYHSSYNAQRDMVLNFGNVVTGYYKDKTKNSMTVISDTTHEPYFDSNLYPSLVSWLPYKEGYKQDIAIYDYNPSGKIGVIKASIQDVKEGTFQSDRSGLRKVWVVTVTDELGGGESSNIYYIDSVDRRLWKQEINTAGRKMLMQRVEDN